MVLLALLALGSWGCVSGAQIRASGDVIRSDIERARRSGAMRCAPRELATADANLDFAMGELDEGSSFRAQEHIRTAEASTQKALALSKDCAPKQVLVREQQQLVVKIEETDKDGDGVLDKDDQCPSLPGPVENKGCPVEAPKDRDADGIVDPLDKCPDQPEDKDGWQDEDGCPEVDNDGDGLLDQADRCPNEPGPIQNIGCPVTDKDGDGINDDKDKCPSEAEDKDGFQDEDGCPDLDNDADGLPDGMDACPNEAGPPENKGCPDKDRDGDGISDRLDECPDQPGVKEEKGCPKKYKMVVVTKDRIEIKKQIKFATGSAKIVGAESNIIIGEVGQALKDNPQIKKIRVEGHTDSVGEESTNLKLSQNRANSVMSALIKQGVDPARMEAVGFGETKAIASNSTASGRAENRRTEFNIVEQ
jgi:outer membrane protein OmpA-like peptidoglycan-associated protein